MRLSFLLIPLFLLAAAPALAEEAGPPAPAAEKKAETPAAAAKAEEARPAAAAVTSDDDILPAADDPEDWNLPDYPPGARAATGAEKRHGIGEEDTLLDIARHYDIGYVEIRAANPEMDAWSPVPGEEAVIPSFHLLPRARQEGIVVNLSAMRMFLFQGGPARTWPLGVGREGLATPVGSTTVIRKVAGPAWYPTARMREEHPYLPAFVAAGPQNPLGSHALYLGWPTFLIHGSNKPWAIGRRVSSGCMRMYPEDIRALFDAVNEGTKVTVVDQPVLAAWVDDELWLEAHPTKLQSYELEISDAFTVKEMSDGMKDFIAKTAGAAAQDIDWDAAKKAARERRGTPVLIARRGEKAADAPEKTAGKRKKHKG